MKYYKHETVVIDELVSIGDYTKIWHFSHISENVKIGKKVTIGQNVFIGKGVIIGDGCKIQNNVSIYEGVTIEDNVFIGPSVVFTNVINPRSYIEKKDQFVKTLIKSGSTLGANATIICGNTVGNYSFIGAGAVITNDVKNFSCVFGNPARHKYWVSIDGHRLNFEENNFLEINNYKYIYNEHYEIVELIK
jgi:UDP-2-acetamido-3-amino-2,3-dideoxy-glucuronate N-acetyltransferase